MTEPRDRAQALLDEVTSDDMPECTCPQPRPEHNIKCPWLRWVTDTPEEELKTLAPEVLAFAIQTDKALDSQGLFLDCLETVCVALSAADREAADDFIDKLSESRRQVRAAFKKLMEEPAP